MEIDLTDLLTQIDPREVPMLTEIAKVISKYESIKIVVKDRPWYIPKFIHEKLCYIFFGIDIKSKTFYYEWNTDNLPLVSDTK